MVREQGKSKTVVWEPDCVQYEPSVHVIEAGRDIEDDIVGAAGRHIGHGGQTGNETGLQSGQVHGVGTGTQNDRCDWVGIASQTVVP